MGNFSYKLYRLFLSLHSFSVTLLTLGSRLFFILLQINNNPASFQRRSFPVVTLGGLALHSAWGANPGFDWASPAVPL